MKFKTIFIKLYVCTRDYSDYVHKVRVAGALNETAEINLL